MVVSRRLAVQVQFVLAVDLFVGVGCAAFVTQQICEWKYVKIYELPLTPIFYL